MTAKARILGPWRRNGWHDVLATAYTLVDEDGQPFSGFVCLGIRCQDTESTFISVDMAAGDAMRLAQQLIRGAEEVIAEQSDSASIGFGGFDATPF